MDKNPGAAISKVCPRQGYVMMKPRNHNRVVVPVQCKTWRCKGCRDRVKRRVLDKLVYGLSTEPHTYFITVTYQTEGEERMTAASVTDDWHSFLSRVKRRATSQNLMWFKVVEMTKRRQPHLHLAVGGIGERVARCVGLKWRRWTEAWVAKKCPVDCLQHEWAKIWKEVTGDSYILDARPVWSAEKGSAYLGKYLTKAMAYWDVLEGQGFKRRWARSNNWPRGEMRLKGSVDDIWEGTVYLRGDTAGADRVARDVADSKESPFLKRVGPELLERRERAQIAHYQLAVMERMLNANHR